MKTHTFNVYSFFVLGLLIWAFSVFFFMASQWGTETENTELAWTFWTQSYEENSIPKDWFIANYEVFDKECINTNCVEDCQAIGKSLTECNNVCKDSWCIKYVNQIKWVADENHWAWGDTVIAPWFNLWATKRVADKSVKENEINIRTKNEDVNTTGLWFDYKIDGRAYTKDCNDSTCYTYCINIKWEEFVDYCMENCISSFCENIKNTRPDWLDWLEIEYNIIK